MFVVVRSKKTMVSRVFNHVYKVNMEKLGNTRYILVYTYEGEIHGADFSMPTREYRIEEVLLDASLR